MAEEPYSSMQSAVSASLKWFFFFLVAPSQRKIAGRSWRHGGHIYAWSYLQSIFLCAEIATSTTRCHSCFAVWPSPWAALSSLPGEGLLQAEEQKRGLCWAEPGFCPQAPDERRFRADFSLANIWSPSEVLWLDRAGTRSLQVVQAGGNHQSCRRTLAIGSSSRKSG